MKLLPLYGADCPVNAKLNAVTFTGTAELRNVLRVHVESTGWKRAKSPRQNDCRSGEELSAKHSQHVKLGQSNRRFSIVCVCVEVNDINDKTRHKMSAVVNVEWHRQN